MQQLEESTLILDAQVLQAELAEFMGNADL
jgi:hypothetical protein